MLKKCWITKISDDLFSITFESKNPQLPISAKELTFPNNPTPTQPLRHTLNVGVLTYEDLIQIKEKVDEILNFL